MSFRGFIGSSSSQNRRHSDTLPIQFSEGWGVGPVFDWYNRLSAQAAQTSISRLQIRKTANAVPHRFVVLHMQDGSVHRFDRRPASNASRAALLIKDTSVNTMDECLRNLSEDEKEEVERAEKEIELLFPDGGEEQSSEPKIHLDLKVVLEACFAISKDDSAKNYTLYAHNCFFFSWTILMVASRTCLPYEAPSSELLLKRMQGDAIPELTEFIVNEATQLFLNLVVETVTMFRNKSGPAVRAGLSPLTRVIWSLPAKVVRFICRHMFKAKMYLGLRKALKERVAFVIEERAPSLYENALKHHDVPALLDGHLWLNEVEKIIEPALRFEMADILWGSIFDAICSGFGEIDPSALAHEVMDIPNLKFSFLGKRVAQYYAVWNWALHEGLRAARTTADEEESKARQDRETQLSPATTQTQLIEYQVKFQELNQRMFKLAWDAAGRGARGAAQSMVDKTQSQIPKKYKEKREKMWEEIWRIWDETWAATQETTQKQSIEAVDRVVEEVLSKGRQTVIGELQDANNHYIQANVRNLDESNAPYSNEKLNNGRLQRIMQETMTKYTIDSGHLENVNGTMSRIWAAVCELRMRGAREKELKKGKEREREDQIDVHEV